VRGTSIAVEQSYRQDNTVEENATIIVQAGLTHKHPKHNNSILHKGLGYIQ
jgi:hypothetical protein